MTKISIVQRVAVFVDVQNMYHSAKHLFSGRLDYKEVLTTSVADRDLVRAIAYVVESGVDEEKSFFEVLENAGYEIKSKELQIFPGGQKKADWDVGLAMDMIKLAPKVDVMVLVSGDGDYLPLVEYLQFSGVRVELASFGRSTSAKLIERVDSMIDLGQDEKRYIIKRRKRK